MRYMVKLYTIEKQYTVKANGTNEEGKKIWMVFDKVNETFLPQFTGGRFALQGVVNDLNGGILSPEPTVAELAKLAPYNIQADFTEGMTDHEINSELDIQELINNADFELHKLNSDDFVFGLEYKEEHPEAWKAMHKETTAYINLLKAVKNAVVETEVVEEVTEVAEEPASTGRLIAYMRISTNKEEQKFDRQETQLKDAGCTEFYADRISGAKRERPELNKMLDSLQAGDTVYILSIDRLSRSTKDLLEIVELIKSKGAFLKSINDSWLDTTSDNPMSDFLLTVMGALGQMERAMITKRVQEGIDVAKRKGVKLGRPKANSNKVQYALELYDAGEHTINQIVDITGISRATLFRKVKEREQADQDY